MSGNSSSGASSIIREDLNNCKSENLLIETHNARLVNMLNCSHRRNASLAVRAADSPALVQYLDGVNTLYGCEVHPDGSEDIYYLS